MFRRLLPCWDRYRQYCHLLPSVMHGMQLNEAIKTSIASVESPGKVLPSEVPQRTAQLPLRQKVSW